MCPIVFGELIAGFVLGNKETINRRELVEFISSKRVIQVDIDNQTSEYFGLIFKSLKINGTPIPTNDIWIAALSRQLNYPVFTYDKHFSQVEGIVVINTRNDLHLNRDQSL